MVGWIPGTLWCASTTHPILVIVDVGVVEDVDAVVVDMDAVVVDVGTVVDVGVIVDVLLFMMWWWWLLLLWAKKSFVESIFVAGKKKSRTKNSLTISVLGRCDNEESDSWRRRRLLLKKISFTKHSSEQFPHH